MADALNTARSALLSYQNAIATVSHNVANATTRGYSRQRVELSALPGPANGAMTVGAGVAATRIQRLADSLVFSREVNSNGEIGRLSQMAAYSGRVDSLISSPATGLAGQWSSFFAAAQDVTSEPNSAITRSSMISSANQLTSRWSSIDSQLTGIDLDSNEKLETQVGVANQLAQEIAELNSRIRAGGEDVSAALIDKRALRLADLATLVGGALVDQGDGQINLFTDSGLALVMGGKAMTLTTVRDPTNPLRSNVALQSPVGVVDLPSSAMSGEIGGILAFRETILDAARSELDREAAAFATAFNRIQMSGVDYTGAMGSPFFSVPAPSIAANAANTGTGGFTGVIGDLGAFDGQDVLLRFDGAAFTAVRPDTGEAVPMSGTGAAGDPFVVGGVELTLNGAAAAGDRFLLRPALGAAAELKVAISDPDRIAAAAPITVGIGAGNAGNVAVSSVLVNDTGAFAGFTGATIEFTDASTYTIDGGAPVTYGNGDPINGPGWTLKLDGAPSPGDVFSLTATAARSSDNANARILAALDRAPLLNGGKVSLTDAMSQFTARTGANAQLAEMTLEAQQTLSTQIIAERESVSGVNLDEEAANLLQFQQAYQAAAQIISAADQMFQSLLSATRR